MMKNRAMLKQIDINGAKDIVDDSFLSSSKKSILGILLVYCFCMLLSFLPLKNSIVISIIFLIANTVTMILYFKIIQRKRYLRNAVYNFCLYLMIQITALALPLGIQEEGRPIFGKYYFLFAISYFLMVIFLVYCRSNTMIRNFLIEKNILNNKKSKGKKLNTIIIQLSLALVTIIFIAIQIYRMTKSFWITHKIGINTISIDNEWIGLFALVGLLFLAMVFLIVYSLLPMLLFDVKMITSGIIVAQNTEIFRKQYGYTKEEWYGEK